MHGSKPTFVSISGVLLVLTILFSCAKDRPVGPKTIVDKTPPASITNLAAIYSTVNSVTLAWTAPGDDGTTGSAAQYDIRYALSSITDVNWDSASQVSSEPTPKAAGGSETFVVNGLAEETVYYFAVKTADEKPNWSALSNIAHRATQAAIDVIPPAAITDLTASNPTEHTVMLSWTAPGDDGNTGTAYRYDIRYTYSSIDETNWASAIPVAGEPTPKEAGSAEEYVVTDLPPNTTYYFAMKSMDEKFNRSHLSNVVGTSTLACTGCWMPLGAGVNWTENPPSVRAFTVYGGDLVAGGWFDRAGGDPAFRAAAWDGSSWDSLGSGPANQTGVMAMTIYDGQLVTGSDQDSYSPSPIFLWNGSSWSFLSGINHENIWALAVYNNQLIAGGTISRAGETAAKGVAAWNGSSWSALGTGLTGGYMSFAMVQALVEYDGRLIAAGNFTTAGGVSANNIAAWDGSSWTPLGSGITGSDNTATVFALAVYDGKLIAGGYFSTAGASPASGIAAWNGSSWSPLGQGIGDATHGVNALTLYNGRLIAGGFFASAGGAPANCVAAWNGSSWSALGDGMNDGILALNVFDGQLVAGGLFTAASGCPAKCVAIWKD